MGSSILVQVQGSKAGFTQTKSKGTMPESKIQALVALLLGFGLGCAVIHAFGGQPLAAVTGVEPVSMAAGPMQLAKARHAMLPASRTRNFLQPVQASKSPIAGLLDIVVPIKEGNSKKPAELDILVPVTKREMMAAAAAAAVAASPLAARAEEAAIKAKICANNPTAKACSTKPDPFKQGR